MLPILYHHPLKYQHKIKPIASKWRKDTNGVGLLGVMKFYKFLNNRNLYHNNEIHEENNKYTIKFHIIFIRFIPFDNKESEPDTSQPIFLTFSSFQFPFFFFLINHLIIIYLMFMYSSKIIYFFTTYISVNL